MLDGGDHVVSHGLRPRGVRKRSYGVNGTRGRGGGREGTMWFCFGGNHVALFGHGCPSLVSVS